MRTPGHDFELAAGFLLTEGVVSSVGQIDRLRRCGGPDGRCGKNVVTVDLRPGVSVDLDRLRRHFYTSSQLRRLRQDFAGRRAPRLRPHLSTGPASDPAVIHRLPETLRRSSRLRPHRRPACRGRCSTLSATCCVFERTLAGTTPWTTHRRQFLLLARCRCRTGATAQRPGEFRTGAEGDGCWHSYPGGRGAPSSLAVEPGSRTRPDRSRLRPSRPLQHLHRREP